MKPKTLILMGLAVACGLGASYMTSRLLAGRSTVDEEKVEILVAKRDLRVGETLFKPEELFEKKLVAKENEPPESIKELAALKGKIMKQSRNRGDTVSAANLRRSDEGLDIPKGYYAMGMRVNLEGSASGFATLPQSRVNIIQTVRGPDGDKSYAQYLLENVLVLAADIRLTAEGELAAPAQVVTFALTPEEILKVSVAKEIGTLSLSLRRLDDSKMVGPLTVKGEDLRHRETKTDTVAQAAPPPAKIKPDPIQKKVEPKIARGHYDIVNGSKEGYREVTRVYYHQVDDGPIVIERTELFESTRPGQRVVNAGKGGPQDY